jgi:hypothetical protein
VSLKLPEKYELVAGTKFENVHLYYNLIKISMIRNIHGVKMIMSIPLKNTEQQFALYRVTVLLTRIAKDKFIQYIPDFPYFGLALNRHDFVLLTAVDPQQCSSGIPTVCPVNNFVRHKDSYL